MAYMYWVTWTGSPLYPRTDAGTEQFRTSLRRGNPLIPSPFPPETGEEGSKRDSIGTHDFTNTSATPFF